MKIKNLFLAMLISAGVLTSCGESKQAEEKEASADACAAVIENIMTRTSIRQFTNQPIAEDTLLNLVKAGMAAPSAMDKRPWAFIVITERNILDSLNAVKPYFNLKTATAAIVVCGNLEKEENDWTKEYWVQDCSAATENILLAAHAYGLGAVWCGVYPSPETTPAVQKILKTPENIIPLNVVTLGYPAENPQPKDKFNTFDVHYQTW